MQKDFKTFFIPIELKQLIAEKVFTIKGRRDFKKLSIKYYYVVNLLYTKQIFAKEHYNSKGVSISTETLYSLFENWRDGSEILSNLNEWGIITILSNYTEGKARRYRLTQEYENLKVSILQVAKNEAPFIGKLLKRDIKIKQELDLVTPQLNILVKKTSVSQEGINYLINKYPELSDLVSNSKKKISIPQHIKIDQSDFNLLAFITKDLFCTRPTINNRIFSNFTSLKREQRKFILLDGKPLIGTDLVNSQVLFSVPVILEQLKKMNKRQMFIPTADFLQYKKDAQDGRIYEAFGEKIGFPVLEGEVRDVFKKRFYSDGFYCEVGKYDTRIGEIFNELYPNVFKAINQLKQNQGYKAFAVKCQEAESKFMLDVIYKKLIRKRITALTLHDSIYVSNEKDAAIVQRLIGEEIENLYKLKVRTTTNEVNGELNTILTNTYSDPINLRPDIEPINQKAQEITSLEFNINYINENAPIKVDADELRYRIGDIFFTIDTLVVYDVMKDDLKNVSLDELCTIIKCYHEEYYGI